MGSQALNFKNNKLWWEVEQRTSKTTKSFDPAESCDPIQTKTCSQWENIDLICELPWTIFYTLLQLLMSLCTRSNAKLRIFFAVGKGDLYKMHQFGLV